MRQTTSCKKTYSMKKTIFFALMILIYTSGKAQATIGKATYQKTSVDAVIDNFPYSDNTVADGIKEAMAKKGIKGKNSKDYTIYDVSNATELGTESYKIYIMADRKSKNEKDASTVTMLVSKGFDIFVTPATDPTVLENAKAYLNNLKTYVDGYAFNLQVAAQEDVVKKNDKLVNKLTSDIEDMQKKKSKLESDIEKATKDAEAQKAALQKEQQILETLKNTRKS